jgi:hypothetical protein
MPRRNRREKGPAPEQRGPLGREDRKDAESGRPVQLPEDRTADSQRHDEREDAESGRPLQLDRSDAGSGEPVRLPHGGGSEVPPEQAPPRNPPGGTGHPGSPPR